MTLDLKEATNQLSVARQVKPVPGSSPNRFSSGLRELWNFRQLISIMVRRDFLGRYRGSLMGAFWPVINPLGHLMLYTFVFCIVLKVKFSNDPSTSNFAIYLMTGLLPWGALAESLARSTTAILEVPNLVKRVVFPLEILPWVLVVSSMLSAAVGMTLLVPAACIYLHTVHWTIIFLPLIVLSQVLLIGGLSWFLASIGVFVRDVRHMISLLLSVWMYMTPIVYPAKAIPANLHFLCWLNPMAGIIGDYRRVILEGVPPDWSVFALYTTMAVFAWWIGFNFFYKTKRSFADVM